MYRIRDPGGTTQDGIAVVNPFSPFNPYQAQLQGIQAEGMWLPFNCGGAPCTYGSSPTVNEVSVDWRPAFTSTGLGTTLGRVSFHAELSKDNWVVGTGTFGFANP